VLGGNTFSRDRSMQSRHASDQSELCWSCAGEEIRASVEKNFKREQSMARLTRAFRNFIRQDEGAALVEYAILIALIAVICLVVVATVGNKVSQKFSEVASKL
jgi:pilus assembly protein Flp/PilA